jgi:hydrogenase expression/formation protein HypE
MHSKRKNRMFDSSSISSDCPLPQSTDAERITLAYGEGGRLSRRFVQDRILTRFGNSYLCALGDAARITMSPRLAFTTDSYTVTPLFFPGGDIGQLAVYGTVNDLAVSGAKPRWLSLALMIEDGMPWAIIDRILDSIQAAATVTQVEIVTGDTKVVPRGAVDQIFITTSGIGEMSESSAAGTASLQVGDVLIVSGPVGQHGAAVLCARDELGFDPVPVSDCASLAEPLLTLREHGLALNAARDATRGGVAAVLHEWSAATGLGIDIEERKIPLSAEVRAVCELLGLDPLFLACEGTFVAAVPSKDVDAVLGILRQVSVSQAATIIGRVTGSRSVPVCVVRSAGRLVPLDEPAGSPLPRIC